MKIYCFGNEFVEEDSLAKRIVDELEIGDVEFVKCDNPDNILDEEETIVILDVVKDIDEVILIDDVEQLETDNIYSLHDFDLAYFLKLMKRTGDINELKIIGIPMEGEIEEIKNEIMNKIESIFSSN